MTKRIKVEDVMALNPCWTKDQVEQRAGKRGLTPLQVAKAEDISLADRRWVLTQLAARTEQGRKGLVFWAAGCAADVLGLLTDKDAAETAIAMAVAWSEGEVVPEGDMLDAAYAASAASAAHAAYAAYAASAAYAYAAAHAAYAASAYAAAHAAYADAAYADAAAYADHDTMVKKHMRLLAGLVESLL